MSQESGDLICIDEQDDAAFVKRSSLIIRSVVAKSTGKHVWIVKLNNWFDHKWLGFHGHGPFSGQTSLDCLRLPSFHPNRIVSQHCWIREAGGKLVRVSGDTSLHPQRFTGIEPELLKLTGSATLFWVSGNSELNSRGCLMAYLIGKPVCSAWYLGFVKSNGWKISLRKGITEAELDSLDVGPS